MTLDNLKIAVKLLPFPKEVKKSIIKNSESIIEFRKFISEKYTITSKDAEDKIQSEIGIDSMGRDSINQDVVLDAANKTYEYALKEGYKNSEDLKNAILSLSESLSNFN